MTTRGKQQPDAFLGQLLDRINSEFEPETVPVRPETYSTPLNCYHNVAEKVRRDGGKAHYGWAIHKTQLLYEAERHAVWENADEELIDVTPHEPHVDQILFVSVDNWVYAGDSVDNIRINRTKNPLVNDFILLAEAEMSALSYGTAREDNMREVPEPAVLVAGHWRRLKEDLLAFIQRGGQPFTACYCGEQKIYRSCHGRELREGVEVIMLKLQNLLSSPGS